MNKVCLIGRLTAKPVLRQTPSGIATTNFTIAVNRNYTNANGEREADFINVVAWRRQAENIAKYFDKGNLISLDGRIQTGSYTDKNGNKRYTTNVALENFEFVENKKNDNAVQTTANDTEKQEESTTIVQNDEQLDIYSEFGDEIDDNYLD